ncbi:MULTISPECIES: DUF6274 family protein [unclassified Streptomyces]|uniref:DUF6274 family protein n=1 Tax=unclassified Streptomyces TaxID=2593676 RepID=UPI00380AC8C0
MAASAVHETRALLRAHLAAASGRRHLTGHCPVCHRLLRLAMELVAACRTDSAPEPPTPPPGRQEGSLEAEDESPPEG